MVQVWAQMAQAGFCVEDLRHWRAQNSILRRRYGPYNRTCTKYKRACTKREETCAK